MAHHPIQRVDDSDSPPDPSNSVAYYFGMSSFRDHARCNVDCYAPGNHYTAGDINATFPTAIRRGDRIPELNPDVLQIV